MSIMELEEITAWKYRVRVKEEYQTGIKLSVPAYLGPLTMRPDGTVILGVGYAWNGASGPAINTDTNYTASAFHDALYQMIREGLLKMSDRKRADEILRELCLRAGMNKFRAWYFYHTVRRFGAKHCKSGVIVAK
jgi:hypothetical protein